MWGAGLPAGRWGGQEEVLQENECGRGKWVACCDGQGDAALLGSVGHHTGNH